MVKKKKSTPARSYRTLSFVSLALNAVLLGIIGVGYAFETMGSFDYATVNSGIDRMCSDKFRKAVEKSSVEQGESANDRGLRLALVDYPCTKNGAKDFYQKGYKDYVHSLGLKQQ